MLEGQQLGPFLIEKEIGAGAMGAVYRGKYVETGQVVAIKVMAPGLATANSSWRARFEREAEILKQLKHPNIVRLFGVGKHKGAPYYAMEYVKGESLDKVIARRGRLSWEEVVDLGVQLCAALQHAHEAGIVHRDVKPSNLMILPDGTLKLTDFGIAKDLDLTGLTGTNATLGTASYMSPEQCKGDRDISHKSDLYSLGVVLYELATGQKPFNAENVLDLFMLHLNGSFQRPSRVVLEMPVWLDNLICQLLEKKPDQRPLDAAMVGRALGAIQEKVEAQQSAGVDAARARRGDVPRDRRLSSAEDKEAARALLRKKPKKAADKPLQQRGWFRALAAGGILCLLGGIVALLVFVFRPESPERLHGRAERLMRSGSEQDLARAMDDRNGPVRVYLRQYGHLADKRTEQVQQWADDYDAGKFEEQLSRHLKHVQGKLPLAVEAQTAAEKLAFQAAEDELGGDLGAAQQHWQQAREKDIHGRVTLVARRHLALIGEVERQQKQFDQLRRELRDSRREPKLAPLPSLAFLAVRQERLDDRAGALRRYQRLREAAAQEGAPRLWSLIAADGARRMRRNLAEKPQDEAARAAHLRAVVAAVQQSLKKPTAALLDLRATAHDVTLLYEKEPEFAALAAQARRLVEQIDQKLSPRASP